ncbi:hypothetical protein R1sor_006496 [Riccia sorocarpa]|uniref:Uncharacterized protein n=1 Tax=Riccia sorocarpa TaxID=122646 RepID=A0ABD3HRE8_9MARC
MKRLMKDLVDDDDEGDSFVQVRVSRVLGPRQNLNSSSRKRLRKAGNPSESNGVSEEEDEDCIEVESPRASERPPALESFQYRPSGKVEASDVIELGDDDDDGVPEEVVDPEPEPVEEAPLVIEKTRRSKGRKFRVTDSDEEEDFEPSRIESKPGSSSGEVGRRAFFDEEVVEIDDDEVEEKEERNEELDLIFNTLQKCDRIAADLRQELSPNSLFEDRYAAVDASQAKIVSQADVCAACGVSSTSGQILKPYQLVGVNFLMLLNRKKVGGAILADEMGLGKTVQAVAFFALLKHLDKDPGPHLIVAPASLLENWQRELNKWCPSLSVVLFHGNERASLIRDLQAQKKAGVRLPFNVMLTCYTLFERRSAQQKDDRGFLRRWNWSCVMMDEAHFLKDKGSLRTTRLRELAHKAKHRVMLTGTPLQNDLQELWALLEFLLPDIFNTGKVDLSKILGNRNSTAATALQEDKDLISQIKAILGPFVLRRLKSDVMQQLVPKIQKVECVDMLPEQKSAYWEEVREYKEMALANRAAASASSSGSAGSDTVLPKRQMHNIFTQLRKIANHPLLVRRIYTDRDIGLLARKCHSLETFGNQCSEERVRDELKAYNDYSLYKLCLSEGLTGPNFDEKLNDDHPLASVKCQILAKLLPELKESGHRPLIFSQWTQMLDILEWALEVLGLTYVRLDGSTQVSRRQEIVDSFNNDPKIFAFLLSTRAGGQGLNLTGADTVIIHDVDFNPQMDRQAEDRCHRIGQTKPVTVYRLVSKESVDENIYNIAQRKLVLDAAVLESGGDGETGDNEARSMIEILQEILAAAQASGTEKFHTAVQHKLASDVAVLSLVLKSGVESDGVDAVDGQCYHHGWKQMSQTPGTLLPQCCSYMLWT